VNMREMRRDTPNAEAKLAQELVNLARETWLAHQGAKAVELARGIVDRYWGVEGSRATRLVADAFLVYLRAVAEQVKTTEQVDLVLEQYDILTARCLKVGEIALAIECLRSKVLPSQLWGDYSSAYTAASRAITLTQEHSDALVDENGELNGEVMEYLRANLEDRCAVPNKALFAGAVEDMVGFEFEHRQEDSFYTCQNAAVWLVERELPWNAVSVTHATFERFPEREKEVREWFVGNISPDCVDDIDTGWLGGHSQIFSWRLPKLNHEHCLSLLGRLSQNASSDEEETLKELTYLMVRSIFANCAEPGPEAAKRARLGQAGRSG
jgi:hypothetical protein